MLTLTLTQWLAAIVVGIFLVVLDWYVSGEVFSRALSSLGPVQRRRSPTAGLRTRAGRGERTFDAKAFKDVA
jgi:hypothetical protein